MVKPWFYHFSAKTFVVSGTRVLDRKIIYMRKDVSINSIETISCDAGWRNYYFIKLTTNNGIIGWSEYDENFGPLGVTQNINNIATGLIGKSVLGHELIYTTLYNSKRAMFAGVAAQAIGAIENALLDAKADTKPVSGKFNYDILNWIESANDKRLRDYKFSNHEELELFFDIHYNNQTNVNGVHFELTPNDVTECVGGIQNIKESDLHIKYETSCDPRLNHEQSIELAFLITDLIKEKGKRYDKD